MVGTGVTRFGGGKGERGGDVSWGKMIIDYN